MGLQDEYCFKYIQNKLGGSIKLRSGAKALRYRLHNRSGMLDLINRINGNIHNDIRLAQLHKVCTVLNVPVLEPIILTKDNA
jgi:hypothetical protein